jgi:hypothetical protein
MNANAKKWVRKGAVMRWVGNNSEFAGSYDGGYVPIGWMVVERPDGSKSRYEVFDKGEKDALVYDFRHGDLVGS